MDSVGDMLRAYEDEVLLPLVRDAGLTPIRNNDDYVMTPGTLLCLMNTASTFAYVDDRIWWTPISLIYCDLHKTVGTVFKMEASFDPQLEAVSFERSRIYGVIDIARFGNEAVWRDPYTNNILMRFPQEQADKVLMNSWYLFQGAVLPMLERDMYRFVGEAQKFAFQQTMIRHINNLYEQAM